MLNQDYLSLRLGRLRRGEQWTHERPGLSFVFAKGGSGTYQAGTTAGCLRPGDLLVMDGALHGRLGASDDGEVVFWWFAASCEHLFPLFDSSEICLVQGVVEELKCGKLYSWSSPTAQESHRLLAEVCPQFNLDHRSQLLRVVAIILAAEFKNAHGRRVGFIRPEEHMTQVFEELSASDVMSLSVGELAKRFSCSRRHLNRLFHRYFGVSVAAWRMEMRLSKAVSLLRDPDAKIIRVAEECGFNHLGLFNTCFKKRFGTSPGKWRKNEAPAPAARLGTGASSFAMPAGGLYPWMLRNTAQNSAAHQFSYAVAAMGVVGDLLQWLWPSLAY